MEAFESIGKMLLILGGFIFIIGLIMTFAGKIPYVGRLPGDIVIQREGFSCYFPVVTSIVLSILLTILLNVIVRLLKH
ncbi:MAG TPA: DUF2905 domain-containing protein [Anaerolineae bacterium]|nr:DUF2905 domain-containing protein [Anaerolineae bacterium]